MRVSTDHQDSAGLPRLGSCGGDRRQPAVSAVLQRSPMSHSPPAPRRRGSEPGPRHHDGTSQECQHWAGTDATC